MHILLGLVGLLVAGAFWYYRIRMIGAAASDAVDAAQRARGAWNRRQFRKKVEGSPVSAIEDPVAGAAVIMIATCKERGVLKPETEAAIKAEMRDVMGVSDPGELFTFAQWAASEVTDPNDVTRKLSKLWMNMLSPDERRDLIAMVARVASMEGPLLPQQMQVIQKLKERLAIA